LSSWPKKESRGLHLLYALRKIKKTTEETMKKLSFFIALVTALGLSNPRGAQAGDYPEKVVQIIEDSAAGSTPDVALRFVADELSKLWGQQVLVVNHPGAGGSLAARVASAAAPDGYTLYQPVSSTFVALHPAAPNVPLKVPRDFLPIGFVSENPTMLAEDLCVPMRLGPALLCASRGVGASPALLHLWPVSTKHEPSPYRLLWPMDRLTAQRAMHRRARSRDTTGLRAS
jgi:hypothetical protein